MSHVGSLDPYSMKILKLCYIIWSTCSLLQSGLRKVCWRKIKYCLLLGGVCSPKVTFRKALYMQSKSLIGAKWFMLLKYPSYIVTISSPGSIRTQWNDRKVDRRKMKKELLRGGFRSQKSVFRKGFCKKIKWHNGSHLFTGEAISIFSERGLYEEVN